MYMFAQERAIDTENEIVTANIIRSVARDKFAMLRDVLIALRENNKGALARWDDVYPVFLKKYFEALPQNDRAATKIDGMLEEEPAIKANLVGAQEPKASSEPPETQAAKSLRREELSATVNERTPHQRHRRAKSSKSKTSKGTLPSIIANLVTKTGDAAYDALKEAGYVRSGAEFVDKHA